jgi:hypothetical protein
MIKWKNINNRFSHDDRDLQLRIAGRHWTNTETAIHEEPMKMINAPIRAARWGGRAV